MHQALLTFNAGEVTPYLRHRIDFDKTGSAAEVMENFLAMPYGGVVKRPGLEYLAPVEAAGENSRLLPFVASDGSRYLLHFTPDLLTVYDPLGAPKAALPFLDGYEWPDPFDWSNSLRDVQMVQLNDVAYIAHPACAPLQLSRLSDTSWTLAYIDFPKAPMTDENLDPAFLYAIAGNPLPGAWADVAAYAVGDHVLLDSEWTCITAHTSSTGTAPGVGSGWQGFWQRRIFAAGESVTLLAEGTTTELGWNLNNAVYDAGDLANSAGDNAICIASHTAAAFAPEDPATTQEWAIVSLYDPTPLTFYALNMHREYAGDIYRCLQDHSSDAAVTEPTVGSSWEDYWIYLKASPVTYPTWFLSDEFPVNTRRSNGGIVYIAESTHRPEANNEPGVGAVWGTYWRREYAFGTGVAITENCPGTYFKISPDRGAGDAQAQVVAGAAAPYPEIVVQGAWDLFTFGTWRGTYYLERCLDLASAPADRVWTVIRTYQAKDDRNVADTGTESVPTLLRLSFSATDGSQTGTAGRAALIPRLPYVTGYALMTERISGTELQGVAATPILSGRTWRWAEGAFSNERGFPRAIAMHDARLVFAGTAAEPVSIWCSQTDDFTNFETGSLATSGIYEALALTNASPIRWLASQRRLIVGTAHGEWIVGSESTEAAMSPTNFMGRQHSAYGTAPIVPLIANDALFFCERKGTRLREFGYSAERGGYDAADLSRIAEHLTSPGISNMAWQQTREPGLWVIRRDGVLLHFAYARAERLAAWSRHTTVAGLFRDVAVLPSDDGDDEVFFIVDRGEGFPNLERFPQHWQAAMEAGADFFHLDGVRATGDTIAAPGHVAAYTGPISTLIDGVSAVVDNTTLPAYSNGPDSDWQIGFAIASRLVGLPIDTAAGDGTTQARSKRTHKILLSLYQSAGGHLYNRDESRRQPIRNTRPATLLRTGWEETVPDAGALDDLQLRLVHSDPFPFCLRAAVIRWQLHEA